jgi:menaquinone-dependent protoporphyrinogen oxidase
MTILVGYASAHWSTQGIALEIADRLLKGGHRAIVRPMAEVQRVTQYEAVVLGSALYQHAWLREGAEFLDRHERELAKRPVWLFSVSSVGESPSFSGQGALRRIQHAPAANRARSIAIGRIQPRDHHHFTGAVERDDWNRAGDFILRLFGGSRGDCRSFRDVDDWASGIARELEAADRARERRRLHLSVRGKP